MKGQKSLEMIIGLIILLVVAAVVINLFLNYVSPSKVPKTPDQLLETRNAKGDCENLCTKYKETGSIYDAVEYCTKRFPAVDWNRNKRIDSWSPHGIWDVCEDAVYCFHLVDCEGPNWKLDMDECRRILCQVYLEKYDNDYSLATEEVLDKVSPGTCDLPNVTSDNWWLSKFALNVNTSLLYDPSYPDVNVTTCGREVTIPNPLLPKNV